MTYPRPSALPLDPEHFNRLMCDRGALDLLPPGVVAPAVHGAGAVCPECGAQVHGDILDLLSPPDSRPFAGAIERLESGLGLEVTGRLSVQLVRALRRQYTPGYASPDPDAAWTWPALDIDAQFEALALWPRWRDQPWFEWVWGSLGAVADDLGSPWLYNRGDAIQAVWERGGLDVTATATYPSDRVRWVWWRAGSGAISESLEMSLEACAGPVGITRSLDDDNTESLTARGVL